MKYYKKLIKCEETKIILKVDRLYLRKIPKNDFENSSMFLKGKREMYAYERDLVTNDVKEWLHRQIRRYEKNNFGTLGSYITKK